MAGLLSQRPKIGGLLGNGADRGAGIADYALALLAGGLRGAAGLALDQRMSQRERARLQPFADELNAQFAPQTVFSQGGGQPSTGMVQAPRATEQNGILSRPMVADPALQGSPSMGSRAATPSLAQLAPLLLRARAQGMDVSPWSDLAKGIDSEQQRNRPTYYNTRRGIMALDPETESVRTVYDIPDDPDAPPSGYRRKVDGSLEFIPGGPADPEFVGRLTGVRREAVVSRPMPGRAKPKAAGGGSTGLPPGYRPK